MDIKNNYIFPKVYVTATLTIFWLSMPLHSLQSKITIINNDYPDWSSSITYLYKNPGYRPYQTIKDIKQYGCNWGTWVTFPQKIEAIQARLGNIRRPLELFHSKDFLVIYKHRKYYKQAFLDYIKDNHYSLEQKKIAIYAMYGSVPYYVNIVDLWEEAYKWYQKKEIELPILELILVISMENNLNELRCHKDGLKRCDPGSELVIWLHTLQNNLPKDSTLYKNLTCMLSGKPFPKSWEQYLIHSGHLENCADSYYSRPFPFYAILDDAVKDMDYLQAGDANRVFGLDTYPYFLIAMEHPADYYPVNDYQHDSIHFIASSSSRKHTRIKEESNGLEVLAYKGYTDEEKSMAIFGMSQLGLISNDESSYYASILENAIVWYKQGRLSVQHLLQFFHCGFETFYKYPFFILDYKRKDIQNALDKLIAEPTIPEGIKTLARKVKKGTLATKKEMKYMEEYRTFRKTHFTLYETVVPRT